MHKPVQEKRTGQRFLKNYNPGMPEVQERCHLLTNQKTVSGRCNVRFILRSKRKNMTENSKENIFEDMIKNQESIFESYAPEDTFNLGRLIGEQAHAGQIFLLNGDLGVGKTVFTQGVAAGLGITEPVNSPTFTILNEYREGRMPLFHFDVYRIEDPEEMEEVGYDDYFFGEGICLIEWAEQIAELLPEKVVSITIEKDPEKGFDYRRISVKGSEKR